MKNTHTTLLSLALTMSLGLVAPHASADSQYDPEVIGQIFPVDDLIPDFSPAERDDLSNAFGTYTSATTVFTGLNSVAGGAYSFDRPDDEDDVELDVYRLPLNYTFGEKGDTTRLSVRGVVGHFKGTSSNYVFSDELASISDSLPPEIQALPNNPDFVRDTATSLGAGLGVQVEPLEGLTITPAFDFIWTHIRTEWDYNNFLSAFYGAKFDRELFNTSVEAISYVPSLRVGYEYAATECFSLIPSIEYSHLWTNDLWSKSSLGDFSIDAGVTRSTMEGVIKTPWDVAELPVSFRPYVIRTDLAGAAKDGLGLSYFHDIGLDVAFDTSAQGVGLSELRLGGAYIVGDDFSGYRIGVSGSL